MEAKNWKIQWQKRRITRKEYRMLWNEFKTGGSCHRRAVERRQREMMLREVHCPRKKETFVREYKAMHEETFLSSGLRKHRRKKQGHGQIGQRRKAEVVKERRSRGENGGQKKSV